MQALERSKLVAARDLLQTHADAQQIGNQTHLNAAQTDRTLASLDQETAEHQGQSRVLVLAPTDGTATTLTADLGQTVAAGVPLASIIPKGEHP